jgi:hypothetical protein
VALAAWCYVNPQMTVNQTARRAIRSFSGGPGAPRRGEPIRGGIVTEDVFHSTNFTWDQQLPPLAEKAPLVAEGTRGPSENEG